MIGSKFDDFLKEEGIYESCRDGAIKKVLAAELAEKIEAQGLTKSVVATELKTSRAALDRLLDPDNSSATLVTMSRVAAYLGKELRIELVAKTAPATKKKPLPVARKASTAHSSLLAAH